MKKLFAVLLCSLHPASPLNKASPVWSRVRSDSTDYIVGTVIGVVALALFGAFLLHSALP